MIFVIVCFVSSGVVCVFVNICVLSSGVVCVCFSERMSSFLWVICISVNVCSFFLLV